MKYYGYHHLMILLFRNMNDGRRIFKKLEGTLNVVYYVSF